MVSTIYSILHLHEMCISLDIRQDVEHIKADVFFLKRFYSCHVFLVFNVL